MKLSDATRGATTYRLDPLKIKIIGRDTEDGPEHDLWQKRAMKTIDAAFVQGIIDNGVLEPVIVRSNKATGEIECIVGRRRIIGTRLANEKILKEQGDGANLLTVPALGLVEGAYDPQTLIKIISLENAAREDLDPFEEAEMMQRCVDRNVSLEDIATSFACNQQTVRNRLQLLNANNDVKKAVTGGELAPTAALKLAALPKNEQSEALEELRKSGNTGMVAAARTVRKRKSGKKPKNGKARKAKSELEYDPPKKRLLKKLIEDDSVGISWDAFNTIRWMLGLAPASQVKGLAPAIKQLETQ